jgi:hypothetical protein
MHTFFWGTEGKKFKPEVNIIEKNIKHWQCLAQIIARTEQITAVIQSCKHCSDSTTFPPEPHITEIHNMTPRLK